MKLLNKSIRSYLIYSVIILLVSIPFLYLIIQQYVVEDVDESLAIQKEQIIKNLKIIQPEQVGLLEKLEPDASLTLLPTFRNYDTFYTLKIFDTISNENIPHRILESNAMILGRPYQIKIKNSLLDSKHLIESILIVIAFLIFLITAGMFLINRRLSKRIWTPFNDTLGKLRSYQVDKNEELQLSQTDIREFRDLNKTILSLTQRNKQIYQSQKEFTENAAHELQTPLAIFKAKLELLMQTTPLNDEQASLISDLDDASQRLNRLNKSLLLLTKIQNDLFLEKESISVRQLTQKLIDQYSFQLEKKNITLQTDYADDDTITANRTLIEILFSNLLSNAIRHNIENGTIYLSLKKNTFTIRNTGKSQPLKQDVIFDRFQKESTDRQSSGLGLAIVQKITTLYKCELTYSFSEGMHCFALRFLGEN